MKRTLAPALLFFILLVLWNTLTIRAATTNPDLAASVRPNNEIILQRQAVGAFPVISDADAVMPPRSFERPIALAQASLEQSAFTPNAAGVVGLAKTLRKDTKGVRGLLAVQQQIGWRDRLLLLASMIYHAERAEIDTSIAAMATLSRVQRNPDEGVFPTIVGLAQYEEALPPIVDLLASSPAWRTRFMVVMGQYPENGELFAELISQLLDQGERFTADELAAFFVVNRNILPLGVQWSLWRRAFYRNVPDVDIHLRDGRFEAISGPFPYSWRIGEHEGVTSAIVARPDGIRGKWFEATVEGDANREITSQFLTATPGRWKFSISVSVDSNIKEMLSVSISCLPSGAVIAESKMVPTAVPAAVATNLTIPGKACDQQLLSIASQRNISETPFVIRLDDATLKPSL